MDARSSESAEPKRGTRLRRRTNEGFSSVRNALTADKMVIVRTHERADALVQVHCVVRGCDGGRHRDEGGKAEEDATELHLLEAKSVSLTYSALYPLHTLIGESCRMWEAGAEEMPCRSLVRRIAGRPRAFPSSAVKNSVFVCWTAPNLGESASPFRTPRVRAAWLCEGVRTLETAPTAPSWWPITEMPTITSL